MDHSHLDWLEEEAIFILREVAATFERPALLFSGGKDSCVVLRLAEKAFKRSQGNGRFSGRLPFPLLHVDTGHNFPEVIRVPRSTHRRDGRAPGGRPPRRLDRARHGAPGRIRWSRATATRRVTLLEAIEEHRFDCLIGGARRDEEKARAKERIFSHRDSFGQWQPKEQRPELWTLFNTRITPGRALPRLPDQQLDRARRVAVHRARDRSRCRAMYYAHQREVIRRRGLLVPVTEVTPPRDGEAIESAAGALSHGGRHDVHLPGRKPGRQRRRGGGRDADRHHQRARRHAHGRSHLRRLDGAAQEGRVFLMICGARP